MLCPVGALLGLFPQFHIGSANRLVQISRFLTVVIHELLVRLLSYTLSLLLLQVFDLSERAIALLSLLLLSLGDLPFPFLDGGKPFIDWVRGRLGWFSRFCFDGWFGRGYVRLDRV